MTKEENHLFTDRPEGAALFEELRSEEIQEVLGHTPPWAVRLGNTLFLVILLGILGLSWLIKYPEIVTVPFRLTSADAPKAVLSKTQGRLVKLWVKDTHYVEQNQPLAYLESTASHPEVLALETALQQLAALTDNDRFETIAFFKAERQKKLGELQPDYQSFMQVFTETVTLFANGYLRQKRAFLKDELMDLMTNHDQLSAQYEIQKQEFQLVEKEFAIHKHLFKERVIAPLEYNREERNYLAKQLPLKQLEMSITHNKTAQTLKQKELAELEKQANDRKVEFSQALSTLQVAVATWKTRFIVSAPRAGQIFYADLWQEDQPIKNDEILFYVGSSQKSFLGEARISQRNSGKVKEGQRVLIKFQSYPFEQFGIVEGKIQTIAAVPSSDSTFRAVVGLPKGLQTSSHKTLPFKNGLNATAEIITEDLSVAERMFYEVRKMLR
ncbi:HlyD family secretion protein [Runella slithyformis]|uniref:Secretion protein HlyD family protein n=1 Tax=Runella slithyformis (strain ATCC 29530 / DSM 19594 / LMG 11500 / NCIMB 11436 / LSU 4) TaxID=761193 RepID=A0A7U3ZLG1_RUNSL|nr:HlyD family efflux transporter periplasmic adaptor subunit [Runella slithyformis]AEI49384.1 secretion protein HlyD family protein [Runella slithyformis DSM 19594]